MSQFEYLVTLVSILIGLGLADLARSLRDLVLPDTRVHWHILPAVWAVIVLGYVLTAWWVFYRLLQSELWHQPILFLPVVLATLALYLLCAFALPNSRSATAPHVSSKRDGIRVIDLRAFHLSAAHRRWFFGTAAVFSLLFFALLNAREFHEGQRSLQSAALNTVLTMPFLAIPHLVLAVTRRLWVHWALTIYSMIWLIYLLLDASVALTGEP